MASELRVDKIIPSSGASIGIGTTNGTTTVVNNLSVGSSVTANAFYGDGSGLTGAGPTLANGADNRVITATGANAIQGEANLTFDGDTLLLKSSTDGRRVSFAGDGTSHYMKYDNTLGGIILNGYGGIAFETNGTNERFRITSTGNFGLATSSPVAQTTSGSVALTPVLDLKGTGSLANASGVLQFTRKDNSTQGSCIYSAGEDAGLSFRNTDGNGFGFYNGTTLSVRIKPNGKVFFGSGDTQRQIGGGDDIDYVFEQLTSDSYTIGIHANQNNQRGIGIHYPTGKTPEAAFIYFVGTSPKTVIRPDGDLENANNNYSGLSDSTLKENIVDANSQWDDIKNIKIRNFNFKASTGYDTHKQIGVVAQELETVCPNLVDVSTEHGMKTVSSSVLYMKGLKALQEAMIKIETLEAEVAALKAK